MDMWEKLKSSSKPILIYGTGNGADKLMDRLEMLDIPVSGIFVNDEFARGQIFRGHSVVTYGEACRLFGDMTVLLAYGSHLPSVLERIRSIASEQELYAPDLPLFGENFFTENFYSENLERFEKIRALLADEESRETFDAVLAYKRTWDIGPLLSCRQEDLWDLIEFRSGDSFLDLGAYSGDTVKKFLRYCPGYSKIIAVEPDASNFGKLKRNTEKLAMTEIHNCGISDKWEIRRFSGGKGRGSSVGEGEERVFDSVDDLLLNRSVSFLKMDIEGMEEAGILGAKKCIQRCRPAMVISAYHRPEDLFRIPELVYSVNPDYALYLRKGYSLPAWDLEYLFLPKKG